MGRERHKAATKYSVKNAPSTRNAMGILLMEIQPEPEEVGYRLSPALLELREENDGHITACTERARNPSGAFQAIDSGNDLVERIDERHWNRELSAFA
jgi:hypothetical protein